MVRPAQTARSERTRDALIQAAMVRFLAQGVEEARDEFDSAQFAQQVSVEGDLGQPVLNLVRRARRLAEL